MNFTTPASRMPRFKPLCGVFPKTAQQCVVVSHVTCTFIDIPRSYFQDFYRHSQVMVLTFNQNMQPCDCKARIDKALGSLLSNHDYSHNYSAQIQCLPTSHRIGRSIPQNQPPYHPHSNRRPHHCMNYHTTSITTDLPTLTTITSINCSPIL